MTMNLFHVYSKWPSWKGWVSGWCHIIDGVIRVLTLGMIAPGITFAWTLWHLGRE